MKRRPPSITVISWIFIAAGVIGLAHHFAEFKAELPFDYELIWIGFLRLLAILCGVFMLRGSKWARWLLVVWIGYHVILSALHTPVELAVHGLLFAIVLFYLFRPQASAYFRGMQTSTEIPKSEDTGAA